MKIGIALLVTLLSLSTQAQTAQDGAAQDGAAQEGAAQEGAAQDWAAQDWELALQGEQRSEASKARDSYRHPRETLQFFGLQPGMTVVEVAPGGGWYTEILASLLKDNGSYYAAHNGLNTPGGYYRNSLGQFLQKLAATPELYDGVIITQWQPPAEVTLAPAGSADLVVAFRNVHSWLRAEQLQPMMSAVAMALKPGARFGVVQHRAKSGSSLDAMKKTGYVSEDLVIEAAADAGLELLARSEINANSRDTADHPDGVWNLPPALRSGATNREKYMAIGESDRMTLLFIKPEA